MQLLLRLCGEQGALIRATLRRDKALKLALLVSDVKDKLTAHIVGCPMKARMDLVEDFVTEQRTKQKDDNRWMRKLFSLICAAAGICSYLLLVHSVARSVAAGSLCVTVA